MTGEQLGTGVPVRSLAAVIGANAKRLRANAELTLDQVSIATRRRGLNWSESRVADFEAGRVAAAANIETLAPLCLALVDAGCTYATIPELLRSLAPIQVNDSLDLYHEDLINLLSGHEIKEERTRPQSGGTPASFTLLRADEWKISQRFPVEMSTLVAVTRSCGATEERMRKSLGMSSMLLANISASLWGRTFSQERDRRAGEGANAQKRGQVTRQMRTELQAAIEAATNGDDK